MMFANFRLSTINILISLIIGLSGALLAAVLFVTVIQLQSIETSWNNYQADRSDKARLESVLRSAIGYGGMIHHFKNYVLRHQEPLLDKAQADIGASRAVIGQYKSLGLSEAERVALEDISSTLDKYDEALLLSHTLIKNGKTPEEIDAEVKVSDVSALRGLETLRSEVNRLSEGAKFSRDIKGRIAVKLRAHLGYGGMIHEFKNLILRNDLPRIEKIQAHIVEIEKNIASYLALDPTIAEKIALDDIASTVAHYASRLEEAETLILKGATVPDIDKTVKVDDSVALRGLQTLDREIALQVADLSKNVGKSLNFLTVVVPLISWIVLGVIFAAIIFSVWMFRAYVIKPISSKIELLKILAEENTDIVIPNTDKNNEIGEMARAIEFFRLTIIVRKSAEEEIIKISVTDPLTGLDNRKRFDERLDESIKMATRTKSHMACLMIDLDKFKPVNDTYGHAAGDEVLKTVSRRLTTISRDTDFVARLGGDEFAIIATAVDDAKNIEILAKRIVDQLSLPVYFEGNDLKIGGSVGISVFPEDGDNAKDLCKKADEALYASKDAGRNTFRFYDDSMKK